MDGRGLDKAMENAMRAVGCLLMVLSALSIIGIWKLIELIIRALT